MSTVASLYRHRGYIGRNAWAELRHRYAGSIGGALWAILQPLLMIAVFTVVFTRIMQRSDADVPYVVYLCSALLPWYAFAECVTRATHTLVAHAQYLRKVPIPEQVFIAQSAVTAALGLLVSYTLLLVLAPVFGHGPSWHWLLLPLPLGALVALGFGVGLALGTVFPFIRDVGQVVPFLLQLGFWTYPIVYRAEDTPDWLAALLAWNPVYPSLEAVRALFLHRQMPAPELWAGMVIWAVLAIALGSLVLRKLRAEIRDVI